MNTFETMHKYNINLSANADINAKAEKITNDKTKRGMWNDCAVIESTGRNFRKYYPYSYCYSLIWRKIYAPSIVRQTRLSHLFVII